MEAICGPKDLAFAVRNVGFALGGRSSLPILEGVRFQPVEGGLELGATDLQRAIRCTIPAQITGEGTWILPGQVLRELVARLPEAGEVSLSEADGRVRIQCGESTFELLTYPAGEFPALPAPQKGLLCRMPLPALLRAIQQTAFAALRATETTRLALTGVNMVFRDGTVKLAATNGYRLAIKQLSVEGLPSAYDAAFLVDAQILNDLQRALTGVDAPEVEIYEEGGQLYFSAGPIFFSTRLIQEQFPDFERVIPRDNDIGLYLFREEFLATLRRMEITAAAESGAVTLNLRDDVLEVSSASKEKGEGREVVRLVKAPGKKIEIAFKAEYLIDPLRRMDSNQVALWLSAPDRAGLIEPAGDIAPGDVGFIYVGMPVRLI